MSASKSAKKSAPVVIKAPKITSAWLKVVSTSNSAESKTVEAIENLSATMVLESRLTVKDVQKVIKDSGKVCGLISVSHVPALPTWSKLRALHADFKALPLAKQLSTAMASYDLLGAGKGENLPSVEALQKSIKDTRATNNAKRKEAKSSTPAKPAKKASNLDAIKAFTVLVSSLDFSSLSDAEAEALSNLSIVLEDASIAQA